MVPALYLPQAMKSLLVLSSFPGGEKVAVASLLGVMVLSYRK
jgi:hypothetical protein